MSDAAVRCAVIPAAGRGTRLLPVTRSVAKELLPLGTTPVLDVVAAELAAAGIEELVVVTAPEKDALETHALGCAMPVSIVHQPQPRGLGDAVLQAHSSVSGPFLVALPDALLPATVTADLIAAVAGGPLDGAVAVERVAPQDARRYGIADVDDAGLIRRLVEKPEDPVGTLAVAARYVLPQEIFDALRATTPGRDDEVQLTDAIDALVRSGARIAAVELPEGVRRRDVGSPAGYCAAFVEHALADPALAGAVEAVVDARSGG